MEWCAPGVSAWTAPAYGAVLLFCMHIRCVGNSEDAIELSLNCHMRTSYSHRTHSKSADLNVK